VVQGAYAAICGPLFFVELGRCLDFFEGVDLVVAIAASSTTACA
jgi:hypothetical protein